MTSQEDKGQNNHSLHASAAAATSGVGQKGWSWGFLTLGTDAGARGRTEARGHVSSEAEVGGHVSSEASRPREIIKHMVRAVMGRGVVR